MATFHEMLQSFIDPDNQPGVHVYPGIPPKKLAGAGTYAQYGGETPLVVFDNTAFGSAKAGGLVTSHALYVSSAKGVRIPLEAIRTPPSFDNLDGFLPTPSGTLKIPKMLTDEAQQAWEQIFQVVVGINLGVAEPAAGPAVDGPFGQLVQGTLHRPKIELPPRLPRQKIQRAAASFGDFCDWLSGERILAYVDESAFGKGEEGLVLTDRRLLFHVGSKDVAIPYAAITSAAVSKGVMAQNLMVDAGGATEKLPLGVAAEAAEPVAAFLQGLLSIPPEGRRSPSPMGGGPDDPTGIEALASRLPSPEPRVLALLRLLRARIAAGQLAVEQARDLVRRVDVLAQNLAYGRGVSRGFRLSPLWAEDLLDALALVFGPPLGTAVDGATRIFDFSFEKKGSLAGAAVSSAIGLTALAVVGVGWVSTPGSSVRSFRLSTCQLGPATGFVASAPLAGGGAKPLAEADAKLHRQLLSVLASSEALGLLVRLLWGFGTPARALLDQPAEAMQGVASSVVADVDLAAFFQGEG